MRGVLGVFIQTSIKTISKINDCQFTCVVHSVTNAIDKVQLHELLYLTFMTNKVLPTPAITRLESTYNLLQSKSPVQSMGHQTFPNTDMSDLSFRSRWGHLAHLEGNPRDQHHGTQSAHGSWDFLHSESFFTPNHHVGRGMASYLHSPSDSCVTLRWQRKDRAKNFISSYVYGCCWNVSKAKQLEEKYNWINKNSRKKKEASNRFSSAGFSNGAVRGNISRHFWSSDSLY